MMEFKQQVKMRGITVNGMFMRNQLKSGAAMFEHCIQVDDLILWYAFNVELARFAAMLRHSKIPGRIEQSRTLTPIFGEIFENINRLESQE